MRRKFKWFIAYLGWVLSCVCAEASTSGCSRNYLFSLQILLLFTVTLVWGLAACTYTLHQAVCLSRMFFSTASRKS